VSTTRLQSSTHLKLEPTTLPHHKPCTSQPTT
jgi:hypothetical protein